MSKIILASQSPRRKELLKNLNIKFEVVSSNIEEKMDVEGDYNKIVMDLALQKCQDVAKKIKQDAIVIAADTIVVHDKMLGKPKNKEDAYKMLKSLSGSQHEVVTGIALIRHLDNISEVDYETTKIYFRDISDEEIYRYIDTGETMDKAGSYGIQGKASLFIKRIEGDYYNVVGLPIYKLGEMMHRFFNIHLL
ncbi:MAG: septum formation inhibitor Maf [Clostridiaceae bacterium]|nr:septum formation inhibitor Maf [Clostridiaceae bacterium]